MRPTIAAVGLATAQGSAADLTAGRSLAPPRSVPWPARPWTTCGLYRPARDVAPGVEGAERWSELARRALGECLAEPPAPGTPLFVASSNGAADGFDAGEWRRSFDTTDLLDGTPWAGARLPVASAACASGLHALFLARRALAAGAPEAVVLAVDIVPRASHENFEALRILAPALEVPWQPAAEGFLLGEAAVALRLTREGPRSALFGPPLLGPVLGHDLAAAEGLGEVLAGLERAGGRVPEPDLVLAQGTGPYDTDRVELAAIRRALGEASTPLTTPLYHFGHTVGASGLLSVALAALLHRGARLPALALPAERAADGRPILHGPVQGAAAGREGLIVCRALGGACAAAVVGSAARDAPRAPHTRSTWAAAVEPGPLHHPALRRLVAELPALRPRRPPELLVVRLAEPLVPPRRAVAGGRILPSAVLEMTPGKVALLAARAWGFQGPALCLVGENEPGPPGVAEDDPRICRVDVEETGEPRPRGGYPDDTGLTNSSS